MVMHYDYQEFRAHAQEVRMHFELRRRRFYRLLITRSIAGATLILTFPFWFPMVSMTASAPENIAAYLGGFALHFVAGMVVVSAIAIFSVMPIFYYRRYRLYYGSSLLSLRNVGEHEVSLKSVLYEHLLSYFGTFSVSSDRKIPLRTLFRAPQLPDFDEVQSEDYVRGRLNSASVEMMEARLSDHRAHGKITSFQGLIIRIDISDPNIVLRGQFEGKTLINYGQSLTPVADKQLGLIQELVIGSGRLNIYSSAPEAARRMVQPPLIAYISSLSDTLRLAAPSPRAGDDLLLYKLSQGLEGLSEAIVTLAKDILAWLQTGSARRPALREEIMRTLGEKTNPEPHVIRHHTQCALYDDTLLLMIPYEHRLFEPPSLFNQVLSDVDIEVMWSLMTHVHSITQWVLGQDSTVS